MTGDELAIALHERQGFVLVAMTRPVPVGTILPPANAGDAKSKTHAIRLMVAGAATRAEYAEQSKLVSELIGARCDVPAVNYFYRVEAAD